MGRVLLWLIVAGIVILFSWFVASLPGTVTATIGYTTVQMSVPVLVGCLLLALFVLYVLFGLLGALVRLPRRLRARRALARRRAGDAASTRALVALAAGEIADARREAARARRLLGDTAQTLLLTAEAGERAGRADEATVAFETLTARSDAAFLGYRGLLRQAMDRQDWAEAAALARQAEQAHPGALWVRGERARLAVRSGNWAEALALADADAPKAALAAAAAEAEPDPAQAMKLAKRAWKEDPTLTPAALAYARRLRESGAERRAQTVIRQTWTLAPNPALAEFALAGITDKLARAQAAQRLAQEHLEHPESRFLLASTALAAGLTGEARRQAEAAREAGMNQRRLWLLLAEIEEEEGGDTEAGRRAQRDALRHAAAADPDPGWVCENCHVAHATWHPACPNCGAAGTVRWTSVRQQPPPTLLPIAHEPPGELV
jgi:HemY protein